MRLAFKRADRPLISHWLFDPACWSGPHDCAHRSADIALVAGGNRKRWIIATENMQAEDIIKTSAVIGRMAGNKEGIMDLCVCLLSYLC